MRMEPSCAAKAEAERPASRMAAMTTPNSRRIATPTSCTVKTSTPRLVSRLVPTSAMMAPMKKVMMNTIGSALTPARSEEHTSELQSLMRISYAVFCLKKKNEKNIQKNAQRTTEV